MIIIKNKKIIYNTSDYFKIVKQIKILNDEEYEDLTISDNLQIYIRDKLKTNGQQCFYISFMTFYYTWCKSHKYNEMLESKFETREKYFKKAIDSNCEKYIENNYDKKSNSWKWATNEYNAQIELMNNDELRWW